MPVPRRSPTAGSSRLPAGTDGLCDTRDARLRFGSDWYAWSPRSPAQRLFGGPPNDSALVGAFGRAAIEAQPRAYVRAIAVDLWRYVDPDAGPDRDFDGDEPMRLDVDRARRPSVETNNLTVVEPLYGDVDIRTDEAAVGTLADIQRVVRVHGLLVLACILLALAGALLARGRDRAVMLLLAGTALVPVVLATATTVYNWRYAVPLLPSLAAAGAFGAHVLATRIAGIAAPGERSAAPERGYPRPHGSDGDTARTEQTGTPARRRSLPLRHPLAVLLLAGAVVRIAAMVLAPTAVYNYFGGDSVRYLRLESTGFTGLFGDPGMTAGYPAFLDGLQAIWSQLAFTIALQHVLAARPPRRCCTPR